jgi:radical SAM superfamily enzyme YgiQ (UPF0313 family)
LEYFGVSSPKNKAILVGVAGSHNAFSLSLYNLKAYAFNDPAIRRDWDLPVIQLPLIHRDKYEIKAEELGNSIIKENPQLVAFSCYMWNIQFFGVLAQYFKQNSPEIKIVFGGPELDTEHIMEGKLDDVSADLCISGEGEKTFLELLKNLSSGSPDLSSINGLSYRYSLNNSFVTNVKREPFSSLLEIPSPFLTGIVDDEVLYRPGIEANIETQRGCNLRCSYCIYHKDMPTISYADVGRTIDEVRFAINKGVKRIRFVDANFTSSLDHAKEIMRGIIKERFETRLMVELIPGFIDDEMAQLFHEFNKISDLNEMTLGVGVQTINLDVLKTMRRGIKVETFEKTFNILQKYDIYAKIDLIIGLPGEDIQSIERTMEYMMDQLKGSQSHLLCCHIMRGLPGTELLQIAKEHEMKFTSEFDPHEMYESPILPRKDMLQCLRRTAVIFRLVNHSGWADREFIFDGRSESVSIRDAFFETRKRLQIGNVALIDLIVDGLLEYLDGNSSFVQDRFPYAETWWWSESRSAIKNRWILSYLQNLEGRKIEVGV